MKTRHDRIRDFLKEKIGSYKLNEEKNEEQTEEEVLFVQEVNAKVSKKKPNGKNYTAKEKKENSEFIKNVIMDQLGGSERLEGSINAREFGKTDLGIKFRFDGGEEKEDPNFCTIEVEQREADAKKLSFVINLIHDLRFDDDFKIGGDITDTAALVKTIRNVAYEDIKEKLEDELQTEV